MTNKGCCTPSRSTSSGVSSEQQSNQSPQAGSTEGMILIRGGEFLMGSRDKSFPADGEGPVRKIQLDSFWIDPTVISNTQFAQFIEDTGYITEAEKFEWSFVFYQFLPEDFPKTEPVPQAPWWR
ncbi:MAG: SUMF1/EgtB/PvdO family nonheme iron enzyme, partial [Chloroflexota bacterium]